MPLIFVPRELPMNLKIAQLACFIYVFEFFLVSIDILYMNLLMSLYPMNMLGGYKKKVKALCNGLLRSEITLSNHC